ncbi:DUF2567 domain-containing protein [Mycolicibacterium komossense]|uniref:DUF2567 domain-containing protein n=1 Tax=Mycolicibacterium komossense TaxID=1779 RepID=A0ABT3CBC1_9MYCO|nr:DUF2567 domain-containing protein [Mycolicibacterium komossense]MCV7226778.1 DUF2567 domain-containing protein [Mycolicibacterium komossense]
MIQLTPPVDDAPAPSRVSRGRVVLVVIAGLAVAGAAVGAVWAWIAPPVHGVIALAKSGNRVHAYLGNEADHFFVAAFMMLGLLWVVAVVAPVLVWQWRAHRGPLMVAALSIGAVISAAVATAVGTVLVRLRYDVVNVDTAPVTPEHKLVYFTEAPSVFFGHTPLQMATTLLVPAATAALIYALFAVSTARDDLGGYPPVDVTVPRVPAFVPPEESPAAPQ